MSFLDCINEAESEGTITGDQAERARGLYTEFLKQKYGKKANAEAEAGANTFDALQADIVQRKRRAVLQHQVQKDRLNEVLQYDVDHTGQVLGDIIDKGGRGLFKTIDYEARRKGILTRAHSKMADILTQMKRSSVLGRETRQAKANGVDLVKEVFGRDSGNPLAKEFAEAWRRTADELRIQFNNAGGNIPKRSDWGMPQSHDREAIRKSTIDEWIAYISPRLDFEKIIDERTGQAFSELGEDARDQLLRQMHKTIMTSGFNKVSPETIRHGKGSIATRRADHRFLAFKNAQVWQEYQNKYGGGDPFTVMMDHIEGMSRDIAMMQTFGPNPNSTIDFLRTQLMARAEQADYQAQLAGQKANNVTKLNPVLNRFDNMYQDISGNAYVPVRQQQSRIWAGLGEMLSAAQLGSATIAAILGDKALMRITARIAGTPHMGSLSKTLANIVASKPTKSELIRAGLIAEHWSSVAYGQARYIGNITGPQITQRISNAAMNISGLSPVTQAERWVYGESLMGHYASISKQSYASLSQKNKRLFERYGITEQDWNVLRSVKSYNYKRATWLRPADVFDVNEGVAQKYVDLIQSETDLGIPVAGPRARSFLRGGVRPGTIQGDLLKSVAQYKTFPIVLAQNNLQQFRYLPTSKWSRLGYATEFAAYATFMGALNIQLREMARGRDPIPMFDEDGQPNLAFFGKAIAASGALSLYGDFLFADVNSYGYSLGETIAGPRLGFIGDLSRLTLGNLAEVIKGKDTNAVAETIGFLGNYTPGVSTFYLRVALERMILDQLRLMVDPEAGRRFRRLERKRQREYGQDYWWSPGKFLPERAPDIESAL